MRPRISQLVELKNGETYNGHLVGCDNWMNIRCARERPCTRTQTIAATATTWRIYLDPSTARATDAIHPTLPAAASKRSSAHHATAIGFGGYRR